MVDQLPPRLLTPALRPAPRLPRWPLVVLGVGALVGAVAQRVPFAGTTVLTAVAVGIDLIACVPLAAWVEERLFGQLVGRAWLQRVLLSLLVPLLSIVLFAAIGLVGPVAQAIGGPALVGALVGGSWWLGSAATGSAIVVVLDVLISALTRDFRTRILLIVLALVGFVSALVVLGFNFGRAVMLAALAGKLGQLQLQLDGEPFVIDRTTFSADEIGQLTVLVVLAAAVLLALPAIVSACGKLADAVMERLHPLALGFKAVADGELTVQVEEAGSDDFVALNRAFNQMVGALALGRRLEHAFGAYLGRQVMGRIKAQHGEAAIPASLREASVFFGDIRGFTSMSEKLAPAAVLGVLNRYFERVVAIIDAHEGYLNKFVGDAVVVVFNGPIDQPDHAPRAVRCAIAIQQEVARLNQAGQFPEIGELQVGIGIATGPLVAGNLGSSRQMEYTVIGDTVNLAARLTGKAPGGAVLVNQANVAALPAAQFRQQLEPIAVKGKQIPVTPYQVWPASSALQPES